MTAGDLKVFMIVQKTAGDEGRGVGRSKLLHARSMTAGDLKIFKNEKKTAGDEWRGGYGDLNTLVLMVMEGGGGEGYRDLNAFMLGT